MPTENTGLPAVCAVIVAAGSSRRMGGENKLLMPLCGRPVLAHTLEAFERSRAVRDIVLVCREQDMETYRALAESSRITKLRTMVQGGATRTDSVLAGVSASPEDAALVAVHDGARPLVPPEVITKAILKAAKFGAAAPAIPVKDTIKVSKTGAVDETPDRSTLFAVQTPQVFDYALLLGALQNAKQKGLSLTDDCSAVEALGMTVLLTDGSEENIKITTPLDLDIAELILKRRQTP